MDRFMIRARANEGRKVFLADPATGQITDDWIIVRSRWCDEFQEARSAAVQQAITDARDGNGKDADEAQKLALVVSLVGGWSFEQEATPASVAAFLHSAPQIVDQIDRLATNDQFFFRSECSDS